MLASKMRFLVLSALNDPQIKLVAEIIGLAISVLTIRVPAPEEALILPLTRLLGVRIRVTKENKLHNLKNAEDEENSIEFVRSFH
mmetsp:Transcript_6647/g.6500  ORF Transcript_6647/g.6500 Transcript_6647/m.6500 type:complete len:85 (-) Transcript_6647:201-455(-)